MSPLIQEPVSERLDRLLGLLASRETWTAPALALELEVSLRTVRRDLVRLGARGVPIESEPGRGGGVRVPVRAGLGRLQLSHEEVLDLLLALAIAERLNSPLLLSSLKGLRQKLATAFPAAERGKVSALRRRVLLAPTASSHVTQTLNTPAPSMLRPVQAAFFEQRTLELTYASPTGKTERVVEPHYLLLSWPVWYLVVWDHLRAAVRLLRLDRIERARQMDSTFALRPVDSMVTPGVFRSL